MSSKNKGGREVRKPKKAKAPKGVPTGTASSLAQNAGKQRGSASGG